MENETQVTLSQMEVDFIIKVFSQLSVNPATSDAVSVVGFVQSIISKLTKKSE